MTIPEKPAEPNWIDYSPITGRPRIEWPGKARVALFVCPNFEHYEFLPDPVRVRNPWPRMPHPDILGYGSKDYGNRVGVWRMFEVMDRYDLRCTVSLGLGNFERYPEILEACETRGWDYMCHGIYNTQYLWEYEEAEERAFVAECMETYRRLTGRTLAGWFSPAASHTVNTPNIVAEHGIKYYCDFYHDDQPFPVNVRSGRLITVPYTMNLNDAVIHSYHFEGEEFLRMIKDEFDTLYREGEESGRVMCIALHPYMMGQPHRSKYLDEALAYILSHSGVWKATGEEIADWYYAHYYDRMRAQLDGEKKHG